MARLRDRSGTYSCTGTTVHISYITAALQERADDLFEYRKVFLDCPPHTLALHTEVFMHENVAHADDLPVGNIHVDGTKLITDAIHGFTDDFQLADDSRNSFLILQKFFLIYTMSECFNVDDGIEDVPKTDTVVLFHS